MRNRTMKDRMISIFMAAVMVTGIPAQALGEGETMFADGMPVISGAETTGEMNGDIGAAMTGEAAGDINAAITGEAAGDVNAAIPAAAGSDPANGGITDVDQGSSEEDIDLNGQELEMEGDGWTQEDPDTQNAGGEAGAPAIDYSVAQRTLTAQLSDAVLNDFSGGADQLSYSAGRFWEAYYGHMPMESLDGGLYEETVAPGIEDDMSPLAIEVSGMLPGNIRAAAEFIEYGSEGGYPEDALFSFELRLEDENGQLYTPENELTVTIGGHDLAVAMGEGQSLLVYDFREDPEREDPQKPGDYKASATVYRDFSEEAGKSAEEIGKIRSRLFYLQPRLNDDVLLYQENRGLSVNRGAGTVSFPMQKASATMIVTAVEPERILTGVSWDGAASFTVQGTFSADTSAELERHDSASADLADYDGILAAAGAPGETGAFVVYDFTFNSEDAGEYIPGRSVSAVIYDAAVGAQVMSGNPLTLYQILEDGSCVPVADAGFSAEGISFTANRLDTLVVAAPVTGEGAGLSGEGGTNPEGAGFLIEDDEPGSENLSGDGFSGENAGNEDSESENVGGEYPGEDIPGGGYLEDDEPGSENNGSRDYAGNDRQIADGQGKTGVIGDALGDNGETSISDGGASADAGQQYLYDEPSTEGQTTAGVIGELLGDTGVTEPTENATEEAETELQAETQTESLTEAAPEAETEAAAEDVAEALGEAETEKETEKETESLTEAESETLTETETESVSEAETESEQSYPAQIFEGRVSGVSVLVDAPEGAFPEGTTMNVKRVLRGDVLSEIREAVAEDFVEVQRVQAVDISFLDKDNNEIEPLVPTSVVMAVNGISDEQDAVVVHVNDEGAVDVQSSEMVDTAAGGTALTFDAGAFSLYAIVVTETIETRYIDAHGNTYRIEVAYDRDAGIPAGAQLEVSELDEDDPYFNEYVSRSSEILGKDEKSLIFAHAFDIKLVDPKTGEKYQPKKDVKVSIELLTEDVNSDDDVSVVHFKGDIDREPDQDTKNEGSGTENLSGEKETTEEGIKEAVQQAETEVMEASVVDGSVEFETGSFSVYVLAGYTVDFHWGDTVYSLQGDGEMLLSTLLKALSISEFTIADVASVSFSNPELLQVEQLDGGDAIRAAVARMNSAYEPVTEERDPSLELEEDYTEENVPLDETVTGYVPAIRPEEVNWERDWLLTSLQSFTSNETLTITLADGSVWNMLVTDPTTVTVNGFTYSINNQKTGATVIRRGSGTPVLPARVNNVPVVSVPYTMFPRGTSTQITEDYVNLLFPRAINVPDLKLWENEPDSVKNLVANAAPGTSNATSQTKVWKESKVNTDGNLEITMSFYQDQGQPIDFILVCDETGSMANAATATVEGLRITSPRFIWARAAIMKATRALLDANNKANPYQNEVAFLVWDNRDQLTSGFYNNFDAANAWMTQAYTGHNGTNHAQTFQTLLNMLKARKQANKASGRDAIQVVVYLSDFADGGTAPNIVNYTDENGTTWRGRIRDLLNANCVMYGLNMFGTNHVNAEQRQLSRQGHNYYSGDDPSRLLPAFQEIIEDAISNVDTNLKIEDTLSESVKKQADANAPSSAVTDSEEANYQDGSLGWNLNNGTETENIDGETVTTTKTMKTGRLYQNTVTIPFTGEAWGDTVYAGSTPTNNGMTLKDKNGNVINEVPLPVTDEQGNDVTPLLKMPVKFELGVIDHAGSTVNNYSPAGIRFSLVEKDSGHTPREYTTDTNGTFSVPYSDIPFVLGKQYVLTEVAESVTGENGYNNSNPAPEHKLYAPSKSWILSVGDDGTITSAVDDAGNAVHTPPMTISAGCFRVWNDEKVEAKLIPITVKKVWSGDGPKFAVPFTVYGVDPADSSHKIALTAYDNQNLEQAKVVTAIDGSHSQNEWTKTVYVYSIKDGCEFFTDTALSLDSDHTYTSSDGSAVTDGMRVNQTYSYEIVEGGLPAEYQYGYYTVANSASSDAGAVTTDTTISSSTKPTEPYYAWVDPYTTTSTNYQLHFNLNGLYRPSPYGGVAETTFWKGIKTVSLKVKSKQTNAAVREYETSFTPAHPDSLYTYHGSIFYGLALPSAWDSYSYERTHGTVSNLEVTELIFHMDNGTDIVALKDGVCYVDHGPTDSSTLYGMYIERYDNHKYNWGSHNHFSVTNGTGKAEVRHPGNPATNDGNYYVNVCTLTMTNSSIPLVPLTLRKTWENTPPLQKQDENGNPVNVELTAFCGVKSDGTKIELPVYREENRGGNDENRVNSGENTIPITGSANAEVWESMVWVPEYAANPSDLSSYVADEIDLAVQKDPNVQGNPGHWKTPVITYTDGKPGTPDGKIEVEPAREAGIRSYTPSPEATTYVVITMKGRSRSGRTTTTYSLQNLGKIQVTYTLNGEQYWDTVRLDRAYTLSSETRNDKAYYVPIVYQSGATNLKIRLGSINASQPAQFHDPEEFYEVCRKAELANSIPGGAVLLGSSAGNSITHNKEYPATEAVYEIVPGLAATPGKVLVANEFVANNVITLQSRFMDTSGDAAGTGLIKSAQYTITGEGESIPVNVVFPESGARTGETLVYLPEGEFSITQDSYTLADDTVVLLDTVSPYTTTVGKRTEQMEGEEGQEEYVYEEMTFPFQGNDAPVIRFDNTRKEFPVYVQIAWNPELEANEDPFQGNYPEFTLQLGTNQAVTQNGTLMHTNTSSNPVVMDNMPSYDVYGKPVQCVVSGEGGIEALLPDYNVTSEVKEVSESSGNKMVHTFHCDLKRTTLTVTKYWQINELSELNSIDSVTLTLRRADGKPFRIGDEPVTGSKTFVISKQSDYVDALTWETTFKNIDVSKSYLPGSNYILTETKVGTQNITESRYEPTYQGFFPAGGDQFTAEANSEGVVEASFRLVRGDEPDPVEDVTVTNREKTNTFTIVKLWTDLYGSTMSADNVALQQQTVYISLYAVKKADGDPLSAAGWTLFADQSEAMERIQQHIGNTALQYKFIGEFPLTYADNYDANAGGTGVSGWKRDVDELPVSWLYYAVETGVNGDEMMTWDENGRPTALTEDGAYYDTLYSNYTRLSADTQGSMTVTNKLPYICKIVHTLEDENGSEKTVEVVFPTLNKAVNYARANKTTLPMSADNPVKIEMLVDYVIPYTDKVTLDQSTDNIIITTAATSGGVYNFTPTFTAAQGRLSTDSRETAILQRGWNGAGTTTNALFYLDNASARLTTQDIIFDGQSKAGTETEMTQKTGRMVYVNAGSLSIDGGTTVRKFQTPGSGGAIYSANGITVSGTSENIVEFDDCNATSGSGGAICTAGGNAAKISISNCNFEDSFVNSTDGRGGAMYFTNGTITLKDVRVDGVAEGHRDSKGIDAWQGGGIYLANGDLTLTHVVLHDCHVRGDGGGIYMAGGTLTVKGKTEGTINYGSEFKECAAPNGNGGAIYNASSTDSETGTVTLNNVTIDGHDQSRTGGALPAAFVNAQNGGAIYMNAGTLGIVDGELRNFRVHYNGGAIYNNSSSKMTATGTNMATVLINGTVFTGRTSASGDMAGHANAANGGVIFNNTGNLRVTGARFLDFMASQEGGAIYDNNRNGDTDIDTVNLQNVTIDGHAGGLRADEANAQRGGAIYTAALGELTRGGSIRLNRCTLLDCVASEQGGAIFNASIRRTASTGSDDEPTVHLVDTVIDGHDTLPPAILNAVRGGAIMLANGTLEIEGSGDGSSSLIRDCKVDKDGGAICSYGSGTQFKNQGPDLQYKEYDYTIKLYNTTIADCTAGTNGGGINVKQILILKNARIINCHAEDNGGAIGLFGDTSNKRDVRMNDSTYNQNVISGNTAGQNGAGIYLPVSSKLSLAGSPNFGGSGTDSSGKLADGTISVTVGDETVSVPAGNFVTKDTSFKNDDEEPKNGGKDYLKDNGKYKVRQDIYIGGYLGTTGDNPTPAVSLYVTGAVSNTITNDVGANDGSIWVWAEIPGTDATDVEKENNHYQQRKQFAVFSSELAEADKESTIRVFRNAADDARTENGTDSYLTGTLEGDLTVPSGSAYAGYIYWNGVSGSRKVILRKVVKDTYASLSGAVFTIWKGSTEVKGTDIEGHADVKSFKSGSSGVFYTGILDYGTYLIEETTAPSGYQAGWYYFILDGDHALMSDVFTGDDAKEDAKAAAAVDSKAINLASQIIGGKSYADVTNGIDAALKEKVDKMLTDLGKGGLISSGS